VPALLAGAHSAGLLFFLNPALPFSLAVFARAALYYAALLAPLSLGAHFAVARWRGVSVARLVPWSLTVVAAAGALGDGVHASVYAFLLPDAINAQLIKAGLWLALAAVLTFYTALLHTLHHRRYGLRSRALIALAAVGSVYATLDRRTSYRPSPSEVQEMRVEAEPEPPRLALVALPSATLDAVLPLARQGKLPFLAQMLDGGAGARLSTLSPPRPAALWASWATGKLPFRHGIVGPARFTAPLLGVEARLSLVPIVPSFPVWGLAGGRRTPIERRDRTALTVWEILVAADRRAVTVGFEPWLGGTPTAHSASADAEASSLAVRELAALGRQDFARALAEDQARFAAARRLLAGERPPRALFVELRGLEQAALSAYGGFAAANFEGKRSAEATGAARAYEAYLAGLDSELAIFWGELPRPCLLAISSPYGVAAPRGLVRPLLSGKPELRGSLDDAPDGLLLLRGDGIRAGVQASEGRLVDLVPTLLYAVGLPIARDFDGRVLAELFEPAILQRRALSFVPSFEGLRR